MLRQNGGSMSGGSSGAELVPSQLVYKDIRTNAPRYKYVKLLLSNIQSNSFTPTAGGTTQIQFKMPYNTVYNLAKSKLSYQIYVPAQGSTPYYTWVTQDCFNLGNQLITFETGNGLQLLNLPEPQKYSAVVGKLNLKLTDYITNDSTEKPYPNLNEVNGASTNVTCQNVAPSTTNNLESQYLNVSGSNSAFHDDNYFKLGNFAHTILAYDKDIYAGANDLYLKITTGGYNQFCWAGTSATNPTTGAITLPVTAGVAINNVYLYLAVEQSPMIIDEIINKFNNGGLKITIDYPIVTKTVSGASTSQQVLIPFVPSCGKFLKKVIHTIWNSTESLATLMDANNQNGTKLVSMNTYLDSTKLQDDIIVCATPVQNTIGLLDWLFNEPQCRGSPIFSNYIYQKVWFWMDDFTNPDLMRDPQPAPSANLIDGLPMERALQWQFLATMAGATSYIHDNFAIFTREVLLSRDGIQFI
jgi:hypothetical protein